MIPSALIRSPRRFAAHRRLLAVLLLTAPWVGCSSTTELESLATQLSEVQTQLRQLQLEISSKEEFTTLATSLERDNDTLLRAQADTMDLVRRMQADLSRVAEVIREQRGDLVDVRTQLADVDEELSDLRQLLAERAQPDLPQAVDISDPAALYQASFDDFQRRSYTLALAGFRRFLELFPSHDQADSALYWIGECYLNRGEYRSAIREFEQVASRYPSSTRLASAHLRKADAHRELGETARSRELLAELIALYPNSDEALLARQRLEQGG